MGSASVTANIAFKGGAIYNLHRSSVVLTGSASVTENTALGTGDAEARGGRIFIDPDYFGPVYVCSDEAAISPNDPDDPPKVRHVCP